LQIAESGLSISCAAPGSVIIAGRRPDSAVLLIAKRGSSCAAPWSVAGLRPDPVLQIAGRGSRCAAGRPGPELPIAERGSSFTAPGVAGLRPDPAVLKIAERG
jgi:hypothetical protein